MVWPFGESAEDKAAREQAEAQEAQDDAEESARENAEREKQKAYMLSQWRSDDGRRARSQEWAQQINDMVSCGGMTNAARVKAIQIFVDRAVYEALHGETESYDYRTMNGGA